MSGSAHNPPPAPRRLFIDPASYSTGWALFEGEKFVRSGAIIQSKKEKDVYVRLRNMYLDYFQLGDELRPLDQVIIEEFKTYRQKSYLHLVGSAYVIAAALACYAPVERLHAVTWMKKEVGYKKGSAPTGLLWPYKNKVATEDELAAIGMGLYWTQVRDG